MKQFIISSCCMLLIAFTAEGRELPNFRINATGGYSYFLANDPNENYTKIFVKNNSYKKYDRQTTWWQNLEGNAHYLLNNGLGFGIKIRYLTSSAPSTDLLLNVEENHYGIVNLSEQNDVIFLAPSIMYARWLEPTGKFLGSAAVAVGYVTLETHGEIDHFGSKFYGENVGFQFDLGVDYFLTKHISAGIATGYFYSKIKEVRYSLSDKKTKLPENSQPNLSNIKLNLSLSLHF